MFSFAHSNRIGVYIDYSNLFHAKYTLGRDYDIPQFLSALDQITAITQVSFYGAYDKNNIHQFNWTQRLKTAFSADKFYFYFKKLENKGGNQKGNVQSLPLPHLLIGLKNRNGHDTFKTLLHRKTDEKAGLLRYLQSLY
jgi:hypothetical protein